MDKHLWEHIKEYWLIYAFIGQLIVSYTLTTQSIESNKISIEANQARIVKLEQAQDSEAIVLSDIKSKLASIETSILFIRERVK